MAFGLLGLILALAAPRLPSAAPAGQGPLVLERLVLVQRHGVRSPTKAPEALAKFSAQAWPQWPVAPGVLTDHGERNQRLMAAWIRAYYARRGLWPARGCPGKGEVYIWADGQDQRTRVSGQALAEGAFPACGLAAEHGPDGEPDGLFGAAAKGVCPIDADEARKAVLQQAGGDLNTLGPAYDSAKAALARILRPSSDFLNGRNALSAKGEDGARLEGPLADSASLTENLFLEYVQGMPQSEVGWGRAGSEADIAAIMPLHEISSDLMRRTPYIATHNGALMARAVLAALDGKSALPGGGAGARLTAIAGHDTNLSNLAGVLGVDWTLKGQPDKTPPGAALAFEVWKSPAGERFVRVAILYQTLDQLRRETALDAARPAGRVDLVVPGCADGPGRACRLSTFKALIEARLPPECRLPDGGPRS